MEGFVSDEALFNSDMNDYQTLANQYGMSLNDVLVALGALVSGPLEDYVFPKLLPSTEYCIYCYGVEGGKLSTPVTKVEASTTAAAPVDNQITITITNKLASAVAFTVNVTTFDAYALGVFNGSASDAEIESTLLGEDVSILQDLSNCHSILLWKQVRNMLSLLSDVQVILPQLSWL